MLARLEILLRPDGGFTLVEMLVAMISGVVVTGALLAVITTSQSQEIRLTDHVQADQVGRTSLERIQDELHSSCVGHMSPLQGYTSGKEYSGKLEGLNGRNLWFISTYGAKHAGESTEETYLHDINWSETGKSNTGESLGTLTDYRFTVEGGSPTKAGVTPRLLSPSTAKDSRVLSRDVTPLEGATSTEGGTPGGETLFHYFKYATTGEPRLEEMRSAELPPATELAAYKIAEVKIEYQQAPEYHESAATADTRAGHTTTVSGSIVLRFTPSETTEEGTETCT